MNLTLVTVNYNNAAATRKLIDSLSMQTNKSFNCIVVDNSSQPDRQLYPVPWVQVLQTENRGFAAGCNLGIQAALEKGTNWIVLVNNDTTVDTDFIDILTAELTTKTGLVGLPLDEGSHIAYAGKVQWLTPTLLHVHRPINETGAYYTIGAGVAIHKDVFVKIGMLDERYFLYFEDVEYAQRARQHKIPVSFLTSPIIHHTVSASTRHLGVPLLLRYHYRNMFLFNTTHAPWYLQPILPLWAFFGIVKQILKLIFQPTERESSRAIFAGILDYATGSYGRITSNPQDRHRV